MPIGIAVFGGLGVLAFCGMGLIAQNWKGVLIGLGLAGVLVLLLSGFASAQVEATWERRVQVEPTEVSGPVPAVLFVHGCSGLHPNGPDTKAWVQTIIQAGWRFVALDSYGRQGRQNICPPTDRGAVRFRWPTKEEAIATRAMRWEEIAYGMARLQKDPTVDHTKILIFGHSEGGVAVAGTDPHGARALIISGWMCHSRFPEGIGITAPLTVPVLALEFSTDPTIGQFNQGRCSDFFVGRPGSREVILSGSGHAMGQEAAARDAVVDFLGSLKP